MSKSAHKGWNQGVQKEYIVHQERKGGTQGDICLPFVSLSNLLHILSSFIKTAILGDERSTRQVNNQ